MNKVTVRFIFSILLVLSAIAFFANTASAQSGHIKLLAISTSGTNISGSAADLYVEIEPGQGRVFMETFPLSKADTQMSTRFAKDMACSFLERDCSKYDFFYRIESNAAFIGGPSAGGAIAVLTAAVLEGLPVDPSTAMTGIISSGNLIGSVGGLKEKIAAAGDAGMTTVLVPAHQVNYQETRSINDSNKSVTITTNLVSHGDKYGVTVIGVSTLADALYRFTGKEFPLHDESIAIDDGYASTMERLGQQLCDRTDVLLGFAKESSADPQEIIYAENLTRRAQANMGNGHYYAAASNCFSANIILQELSYEHMQLSSDDIAEEKTRLLEDITKFENELEERERNTITDLQAYIVAQERLVEARDTLNREIGNDTTRLAFAVERLESAKSWSEFFDNTGAQFTINNETVYRSCLEKLRETNEVYQYFNLITPTLLTEIARDLEIANTYQKEGEYELCFYRASIAKAKLNVISSATATNEDEVDALVEQKLLAAKREIAKEIEKGIFPIVAYSYYEYGRSLQDIDRYSAWIYAEYSLELSNFDIYFEKAPRVNIRISQLHIGLALIFLGGILVGVILAQMQRGKEEPTVKQRTKLRMR